MKKLFVLFALAVSFAHSGKANDYDPMANPQAVITSGSARFTVLTPEMIRIQYSADGRFEDRATFGVVNRRLPVPAFKQTQKDGILEIKTSALTLRYKVGGVIDASQRSPEVLNIKMKLNGRDILWYPGKDDAMNLKGTTRTLDGSMGDNKREQLENGLLSRAGWAVIDESPLTKRGDGSTSFVLDHKHRGGGIDWWSEPVDKQATDWYFMGYGHQYKKALADYTRVGGRMPMPPLYILGYWYSKYQRYTQQDFMDIATEIQENNIPIDVMIFDMDWHTQGWTGWTWDKTIIPEPEKLIGFMHQRHLKVGLNLHPADGVNNDQEFYTDMIRDLRLPDTTRNIPWQLEDSTFYKVMFSDILRRREAQGVDFWWLDWQQNLTNPRIAGLGETFWCNHVFYNDMRLNRTDRRPVIFHRWGGLGSHRYPIGFSGDAYSTFGTLAFQPYFTATASNVCFGYWGHDLGGHIQFDDNDPELYLRWMQYGVFTPIFRTHATNKEGIERRIWKYPNFSSLVKTVNLRYRLMPYIYNAAREAYDTGVSICRPLYYDLPEVNEAYSVEDEYMFGNDILVAPIVARSKDGVNTERRVWLPEGMWYNVMRGKMQQGGAWFNDNYGLEEIPYFYKAGSIIPCFPQIKNLQARPDTLILEVVPGANGELSYYEDAGDDNTYQQGAFTRTLIKQERTQKGIELTINPRIGQFKGMPDTRHYQVEFLDADRPSSVEVNGYAVDAKAWKYDEATRRLTVVIAGGSPAAGYSIALKK